MKKHTKINSKERFPEQKKKKGKKEQIIGLKSTGTQNQEYLFNIIY